jgi:hypothetical protein
VSDAVKARSYVVLQPITCAAGAFAPGDKVYAPWLNGQAEHLVAMSLLSPTHNEEDVPDVALEGVPGWDAAMRPAPEVPLAPLPGTLTVDDAVRHIQQNLGEIDVATRRDLVERLLADPDAVAEHRSDAVRVRQVAEGGTVPEKMPDEITPGFLSDQYVADVLAIALAYPDRVGELIDAESLGKNRVTLLSMLHVLATEQAAAQLVADTPVAAKATTADTSKATTAADKAAK